VSKFYFNIDKPLSRINKGNQKLVVSASKQTSKRQTGNRKNIKTQNSKVNAIVKDEELMPPPSCAVKQDDYLQCYNSNSNINDIGKLF